MEPRPPVLSVRDLGVVFSTRFGRLRAVDGVSFDLGAGETLGLVGESGSGKTVTARAVMRLFSPSTRVTLSGSVKFQGRELSTLPEPEMRAVRGAGVAMVFQEPMSALNPVLSVGTQIAEAIHAHERVSKGEARARTMELLRRVGIPDPNRRIDEYPHQLSGGMRQRAMIATALAARPRVLIADEPTTALDVTIQAQILELLEELKKDLGMSILLITHDLGVVAESCDRVAVMYAAQIVETAATESLFEAPRHPYTRGLLDSVPRPVVAGNRRLPTIAGSVPNLAELPSGCRFHPRCSRAAERCRSERPGLEEQGSSSFRCFFPLSGDEVSS